MQKILIFSLVILSCLACSNTAFSLFRLDGSKSVVQHIAAQVRSDDVADVRETLRNATREKLAEVAQQVSERLKVAAEQAEENLAALHEQLLAAQRNCENATDIFLDATLERLEPFVQHLNETAQEARRNLDILGKQLQAAQNKFETLRDRLVNATIEELAAAAKDVELYLEEFAEQVQAAKDRLENLRQRLFDIIDEELGPIVDQIHDRLNQTAQKIQENLQVLLEPLREAKKNFQNLRDQVFNFVEEQIVEPLVEQGQQLYADAQQAAKQVEKDLKYFAQQFQAVRDKLSKLGENLLDITREELEEAAQQVENNVNYIEQFKEAKNRYENFKERLENLIREELNGAAEEAINFNSAARNQSEVYLNWVRFTVSEARDRFENFKEALANATREQLKPVVEGVQERVNEARQNLEILLKPLKDARKRFEINGSANVKPEPPTTY